MILTILKILLTTIITPRHQSEPVRLHKQQKPQVKVELIAIALFTTIVMVCLLLIFVTSCTESGLVYNNHNFI